MRGQRGGKQRSTAPPGRPSRAPRGDDLHLLGNTRHAALQRENAWNWRKRVYVSFPSWGPNGFNRKVVKNVVKNTLIKSDFATVLLSYGNTSNVSLPHTGYSRPALPFLCVQKISYRHITVCVCVCERGYRGGLYSSVCFHLLKMSIV